MVTDKNPQSNFSDSEWRPEAGSSSSPKLVKWLVRLRLWQRCTIFFPTWMGSLCLAAILFILVAIWVNYGESYLSLTHKVPTDILVVEGWIGRKALRAAVDEFDRGGYRYVVASGGLTSGRWEDQPTSYAEMAASEMIRLGVPKERIFVATAESNENHRTFESAVAVRRVLQAAGIHPQGVNVFTLGAHGRRSHLVFAKVDGPGTEVGVISWTPPDYLASPWWRSSERAREMLEETIGYLYEALLNSGRGSNIPLGDTSSDSAQHSATKHPESTNR
jgi:hypothetical protein